MIQKNFPKKYKFPRKLKKFLKRHGVKYFELSGILLPTIEYKNKNIINKLNKYTDRYVKYIRINGKSDLL